MSVSVANVSAMRAIRAPSLVATTSVSTVFVATHDDFYRYVPGGTLTPADGTIYSSSDGLGQWVRMFIPSAKWRSQALWSIDESNSTGLASDENTGADDSHPLLTIDEWVRRIGTGDLTASVQVRWLSNTTRTSVNLSAIKVGQTTSATIPTVTFFGVPTIMRSGTLTGAASGSSTPWTVSDSSLPVSWTASVGMSTSSGSRLIRKTDKTKHAFLAYESVAKTAATSPHAAYSATNPDPVFGGGSATFANGESYEVVTLPTFPDVTTPLGTENFNGFVFIYLDFVGGIRGYAQARLCGFRNFASLWNVYGNSAVGIKGGILPSGGFISGMNSGNTLDRTITLGAWQFANWSGDMNGYANVIAKTGSWSLDHGNIGRLGSVYVYDCTATSAIRLTNNSNVSVDGIPNGSGNTGTIVEIRDAGCSFNTVVPAASVGTSFAASTSGSQITVVGTAKAWSDIPYWDSTHNAGFVCKP